MYDFIIMLQGPREKIRLIKMVRFITGGRGLKYCKEVVEASIDFESWMDDYVIYEMRCDAHMVANLVTYLNDDRLEGEWAIKDCERVDRLRVDMDLTANIAT